MLYDCKRIPYRIDRRLSGLAGPDYDAPISFGLPLEPGDSQYGEYRIRALSAYTSGIILRASRRQGRPYRPKRWSWKTSSSLSFFGEKFHLLLPSRCSAKTLALFANGGRQLILGEEPRGADLVEEGCTLKLECQRCFEHPEQLQ